MLMHMTLAVGLLALGGDPAATHTPRQLPPAFQQNIGSGVAEGGAGCATCGNRSCCGPQDFRCHFLTSPCDMPQRMPYWNNERGYYYFRPYHVVHVLQQQERAVGWGGSAHNPYDNRMLDRVHDEWEEDYELREKVKTPENLPTTPGNTPEIETPEGTTPNDDIQPESDPPTPGNGAKKSGLKTYVKFGFSKP